ncbi:MULTISPECIES: ammonium transporter [Mycolicibacterium]|uniref:Ammonium transporter n=1 Tax=Mycolicibacterium vanbaalenii (strain DSM 7251 / JCM 13017 / BCRC 16820 / KCTC 9966 / NRRL B-24157 / PYR-1) TaxID=350058 RepID=A1T743_MYCVP|nr:MULTISPECIES: ammonium transporter [Mycolicibacterium]ABM12993.1 ammonium transporter [Mycolicibacterium vanbaalenii PYR-1]MCV7125992.1 ammonium transporter [Mycolicibacterium vanbaalenii PYR-1]QZT58970.1 ammonium transporter [Mycolicibacterium austroafricanum]QZY48229.1 ammonium transporter [Mycolicibacterium austroafricanum]UJL26739.1 ammonium transporter [Mycolicibacterium vanbaalenii]
MVLALPDDAFLPFGPEGLSAGDTAWVLTSAALVLFMTPGLAFFYGGLSRQKSVLNMMMMSFGSIGVVSVIYVLWGYSMSFASAHTGESDFFGVFDNPFALFGVSQLTEVREIDGVSTYVLGGFGTVPAIVWVAFQLTFAVITVALISGAVAERMKFGTWLLFGGIWVTLVYFPLSHMVWGGGLLSNADSGIAAKLFGLNEDGTASVAPIDFAGGTVVHINAGMAALVLAILLGKRTGFGKTPYRPHNIPFVMLGAAILWFGWFGFNVGSEGAADMLAGSVWVNTTAATAAAMLAWLVVERIRDGHATSVGAASGIVAGLVAITPACGALSAIGSLILGAVAGVLSALAISLKYKFGYDDSLDVVGVHLVAGLWGTVGIGFLATETGLFYGGGVQQLVVQAVIALVAVVFTAIMTAIIAFIVKPLGWRVSKEDEDTGIDETEHAETAYELA